MNILVAGGSGLIGKRLTEFAIQAGHQVWILSRDPESHRLTAGVKGVRWDAQTVNGWGQIVNQMEAIINLTGESLAGGLWSEARKQRFFHSRVNAGKVLVEAVKKAEQRPKVLLQSSGIGYYGYSGDVIVNEDSTPGSDYMAQLCVQWENSTQPVEELGVRRAVLRTSIVLSKDSIIVNMFMLPFRLFVGGKIGSGKQWVSWTHLDDQVGILLHFIQNENVHGPYNIAAPEMMRNADFERAVGKALNRPYWFPIPTFALRLAIGEMSSMVLEGQRPSIEKLLSTGYTFKYPTLAGALKAILERG